MKQKGAVSKNILKNILRFGAFDAVYIGPKFEHGATESFIKLV